VFDDLTVHYNELLAVPESNEDEDADDSRKRKARTCSRSNGLPGPIQLDAPGGKTGITPKH
jgi:hypothetical protein